MQQPDDNGQSQFIAHFLERLRDNPELTLSDFMAEIEADDQLALVVNAVTESTPPDSFEPDLDELGFDEPPEDLDAIFAEMIDEDEEVRIEESVASFADLMTHPTQSQEPLDEQDDEEEEAWEVVDAKPAFSFSQWYADHSIDFILYLGAFMIVAAVSLFVGFQWQNLSSMARFGIVVGFTVAWYVAGVSVQRFMSLESVGMAFLTIGAVITPFCGVAWQRFVIDSSANIGITWLITATISTIIYLTISLVYQRRYFTYFGNLAILASVLSLVEITAAPFAYYVLAGTVTATILLATRMALTTLAPRLDAYLGVDIERSSWGMMASSLIAGAILLPVFEISVFSIEVLAVLVVTWVYAILLLTRYVTLWTVLLAQIITLLIVPQALLTFNVDGVLTAYITLLAGLAVQFVIQKRLQNDDSTIINATLIVNMVLMSIAYIIILNLREADMLSIPAGILTLAYGMYFAYRIDHIVASGYVALLPFLFVTNLGAAWNTSEDFVIPVFTALGILELMIITTPLSVNLKRGVLITATIITGLIGLNAFDSIIYADTESLLINTLNSMSMYAIPIAYAVVILLDDDREAPVIGTWGKLLMGVIPILYYSFAAAEEAHFLAMGLALTVGLLFAVIAYRTEIDHALFVIFIVPFIVFFHIATGFDLPVEAYIVGNAILALVMYAMPNLPEITRFPRQIVAMCAVALTSMLAVASALETETHSIHLAGWVNGYALLAMLWLSDDLFEKHVRDSLLVVVALLQYYWTILYLALTISDDIFSDVQWYSAALASVIIGAGVYQSQRAQMDDEVVDNSTVLLMLGGLVLMFPTYQQILSEQSLLYFGLGVVYSLSLGALAITISNDRLRTVSAIALIFTVLLQSREFLLGLPRWVIIGIVGFGLIGVGLYLSIRRRTVKKDPV